VQTTSLEVQQVLDATEAELAVAPHVRTMPIAADA
jgi:hypothetical protein